MDARVKEFRAATFWFRARTRHRLLCSDKKKIDRFEPRRIKAMRRYAAALQRMEPQAYIYLLSNKLIENEST